MSRDKGQRSRFQNKFYATLIFTGIKECNIKLIMLMALSKHIPEIERQSYTLYREKSVHTLARKHANLNLSAWSLLLLQPMQNKMKNNINPYRSLQVMHVRLRRFNSSLVNREGPGARTVLKMHAACFRRRRSKNTHLAGVQITLLTRSYE